MISSKKYIDETLKKYNLSANKSLGQNFLCDESISQNIVASLGDISNSFVIEIGPGLGALSEHILKNAKHVLIYEIDKNMCEIFKETFIEEKNYTLINEDILSVNLEKVFKENQTQNIKVVSNLPYYITSQILMKLLLIECQTIVVMMQKEVAHRLIRPDHKEYGLINALLDYQYSITLIKSVSKNSFLPRPEIDSTVLKFEKISSKYQVSDYNRFVQIVTLLFKQRRKTIYNNLQELNIDKQELIAKLNNIKVNPQSRAEQLSIKDYIEITNSLGEYLK